MNNVVKYICLGGLAVLALAKETYELSSVKGRSERYAAEQFGDGEPPLEGSEREEWRQFLIDNSIMDDGEDRDPHRWERKRYIELRKIK